MTNIRSYAYDSTLSVDRALKAYLFLKVIAKIALLQRFSNHGWPNVGRQGFINGSLTQVGPSVL